MIRPDQSLEGIISANGSSGKSGNWLLFTSQISTLATEPVYEPSASGFVPGLVTESEMFSTTILKSKDFAYPCSR